MENTGVVSVMGKAVQNITEDKEFKKLGIWGHDLWSWVEMVCLVWIILSPEAFFIWWAYKRNVACLSLKYIFLFLYCWSIRKERKVLKSISRNLINKRYTVSVSLAFLRFNSYSGTHVQSWISRIRKATILTILNFCSD